MITKEKLMSREEIFASITELKVETKVRAWKMNVDGDWYHICSYGGVYEIPIEVSIWPSNKAGKRACEWAIFTILGTDHIQCASEFLDTLNY
jgi:hypothetical protein